MSPKDTGGVAQPQEKQDNVLELEYALAPPPPHCHLKETDGVLNVRNFRPLSQLKYAHFQHPSNRTLWRSATW